MRFGFLVSALIAGASLSAMATAQHAEPYAGQELREIKALSADDIDDLLAGRGWGLAKPAELNGYPGPAHVIELAEELALDEAQLASVNGIFERMQAKAQEIGARYVRAEGAIEALFAGGGAEPAALSGLLADAELLRAELRAVHLEAHIETTPLLTRHQRMLYAELRGYGSAAGGHDGHSGHGGHSGH